MIKIASISAEPTPFVNYSTPYPHYNGSKHSNESNGPLLIQEMVNDDLDWSFDLGKLKLNKCSTSVYWTLNHTTSLECTHN